MALELGECRILAIQSHVVSGYVGNKVATFVLQVCGLETDIINSVQFSNHTQHKHFKGQILSSIELNDLFSGLKLNKLDQNYTHLLTGYMKSISFAEEILNIVQHLKTINPNLIYLCDPVLGDNGKCYVPEELVDFYKTKLIKEAGIITPNQFEAELLSNMKIESKADAIRCLNELHAKGPQIVIISSTSLVERNNILICFASRQTVNEKGNIVHERYEIEIPKFDALFVGTGDLFSSLILVWITKTNFDLKKSIENTISSIQNILKDTIKYALSKEDGLESVANIELRLVQNKHHLENPIVEIKAKLI